MSLSPDDSSEDISQRIRYLSDIADTLERRLLHLIREGAEAAGPLDSFINEFATLASELKQCYRQVAEIRERRDLGFRTTGNLLEIERHCVWLFRKIHLEQAFFRKWHLETKLRGLISVESFGVYQEILEAEEQEKRYLVQRDFEIRASLLTHDL